MPDVTVRANEYLPDPNVKVSHDEWYAVSWEMDFGKQIDEHETPEIAEKNEQVVTQEVANSHDETTTQQVPDNQTEDTNDAVTPSPDFSNLTTDAGDDPYIRRPHPLKVHLFHRNHLLQSLDIIQGNQQSTTCDLILSLIPPLTSDDLTL